MGVERALWSRRAEYRETYRPTGVLSDLFGGLEQSIMMSSSSCSLIYFSQSTSICNMMSECSTVFRRPYPATQPLMCVCVGEGRGGGL